MEELGQKPFPENTWLAAPPSIRQQLQLAAPEQQ